MAQAKQRPAARRRRRKRERGEGGVRKRGKNSWQLYWTEGGRQVFETVRAPDRETAREALRERLAMAATRRTGQAQPGTFADLAERTISSLEAGNQIVPNTAYNWRRYVACHINPIFGDQEMHDITPAQILAFRDAKLTGESAKTGQALPVDGESRGGALSEQSVAHLMTVMRRVFEHWMTINDLTGRVTNPAAVIKRPRIPREPPDPLTPDQVNALLSALDGQWRTFVVVLVTCGLRMGEGLGLRVADWDPKTQQLKVRGGLKRDGGRIYWAGYAKSEAGRRSIPVSNELPSSWTLKPRARVR